MIPKELLSAMMHDSYTEQVFRHRLAILQEILEMKLYSRNAHTSKEMLLSAYFAEHEAAKDHQAWFMKQDSALYESFTAQNLYELLSEIREAFNGLPVLTLYVPIALPPDTVTSIGMWVRREVDTHAVLHVVVEPDLAAGCALVWKGVYHDFSFRYLLRQHEQELVKYIREHENAS